MPSSFVAVKRTMVPFVALFLVASLSLLVATSARGQALITAPKDGAYIYCTNELGCGTDGELTAADLRGNLPITFTKITAIKDFGPGIVGGKIKADESAVSILIAGLEFSGPTYFTVSLYDDVNDVTADVFVKAYFARTANTAPEAVADSWVVAAPQEIEVYGSIKRSSVLWNDIDPDNDFLTAQLVSGPTDGILVLAADGSFTYTPGPTFVASDSFTYNVCDKAKCSSSPATVTISQGMNAAQKQDFDLDGVLNEDDLCDRMANLKLIQPDGDGDGMGDQCDPATVYANNGATAITAEYAIVFKSSYALRVAPGSTLTVTPMGDRSIQLALAGNEAYIVTFPDGLLAITESSAVRLTDGDHVMFKGPGLTAFGALTQLENLATNTVEFYPNPDPVTYGVAIPGMVMSLPATPEAIIAWTPNYTAQTTMHSEGGLSVAVGGYTYPQTDFSRSADSIDCQAPAQTGQQGRLIMTAKVLVTPTGEERQTTCENLTEDLALAAKGSTVLAFPKDSTFTATHGSLTVKDIAFPVGKQVIAAYKPATFGANGITGSADTLWVKPAAGSSFKIDDSNELRPVITNLSADMDLDVYAGAEFTYTKEGTFVQPVGVEPIKVAPGDTVVFGKEPSKVTLCHVTGKSGKPRTISVSEDAVDAHLEHGDVLGACGLAMDSTSLAIAVAMAGGVTAIGTTTHILRRGKRRGKRSRK